MVQWTVNPWKVFVLTGRDFKQKIRLEMTLSSLNYSKEVHLQRGCKGNNGENNNSKLICLLIGQVKFPAFYRSTHLLLPHSPLSSQHTTALTSI